MLMVSSSDQLGPRSRPFPVELAAGAAARPLPPPLPPPPPRPPWLPRPAPLEEIEGARRALTPALWTHTPGRQLRQRARRGHWQQEASLFARNCILIEVRFPE